MAKSKSDAKFTIFLPVRNGGSYLHLCVESILAQSHQYFELKILDNQSFDGTTEWLRNLELVEDRVEVIFSEFSLTIEENWARVLKEKKCEYMTIIGHDDLLAPNFLEEINNSIYEQPNANLYFTHFRLIDANGDLIRQCMPMPKFETAAEFLAARMVEIRDSFGTGYVMKSALYDKVGGIPTYPNLLFADDALWLKLMGSSLKVTSPQVCFSYRFHSASVSGTPNHRALFYGLKQYLDFLCNFAHEYADVARVIKQYGPNYVARRCQEYYSKLLINTPWGRQIEANELAEIKNMLREFANESMLDEKCLGYGRKPRLKFFVSTKVKKYSTWLKQNKVQG